MKYYTLILLLMISFSGNGQETTIDYSGKADSLDTVINSLYDVVSAEKGEARDWELFRYLFHESARLMPSGKNREGNVGVRYLTVDDYINAAKGWTAETGFVESEINRVVDSFGVITQVFSTYEAFRSESDTEPFMRGINSIQLLNDGNRWWILNIYWTQETPNNPIPDKYLPQK